MLVPIARFPASCNPLIQNDRFAAIVQLSHTVFSIYGNYTDMRIGYSSSRMMPLSINAPVMLFPFEGSRMISISVSSGSFIVSTSTS
jgi:hypothetical protein